MALRLVRRSALGWSAEPNRGTRAACANGLVVHFDGFDQGLASKDHGACLRYWRSTRAFHMGPERGWNDIGYSFFACAHGYVLEGRGFGWVQAAQPGGNSSWTSVTFATGPHEEPTAAQLQAFRDLRAWLREDHGLGAAVRGHRNFLSTDCPGPKLYALVQDPASGLYVGGVSAPAAKPSAPSGVPPLGRGDSGARVRTLQRALSAALKVALEPDGDFGGKTEIQLKVFQGRHTGPDGKALAKDGLYGKSTAWALARALKG